MIAGDEVEGRKKRFRLRYRMPGDKKISVEYFLTARERDAKAEILRARETGFGAYQPRREEIEMLGRLNHKARELGLSLEALLEPIWTREREHPLTGNPNAVELWFAVEAYKKHGKEVLKWGLKQQANVRGVLKKFAGFCERDMRPHHLPGPGAELSRMDHGIAVDRVTQETVRAYLKQFRGYAWWSQQLRIIKAFYRFCLEKKWVDDLTMIEGHKWPRILQRKSRKPTWLIGQVKTFILAAEPDLRAHWLLRFKAGIRAWEMMHLQWSWHDKEGIWYGVDFEKREIHMAPEWTKMNKYRRIYDLGPAFWQDLETARKLVNFDWVTPRHYVSSVREEYQKRYTNRKADALKEMGLQKMPQNLPRHTFASMGYQRMMDPDGSQHQGLEWVLDLLGHEEDLHVFNRNYKGNVTLEEAIEYRNTRILD